MSQRSFSDLEYAGKRKLVVDDGLIQVVSLQAEPIYFISRSSLIHGFLMNADGFESLLQERLTDLSHAQNRSFHHDIVLDQWA